MMGRDPEEATRLFSKLGMAPPEEPLSDIDLMVHSNIDGYWP